MNITDNIMWTIEFNYIDWRNGILMYDGDALTTYMCVDPDGELICGITALSYFAEYGVPYEELVMLYDMLMKHDEISSKVGILDEPLYIIHEILQRNKIQDTKKNK